MRDALFAVGTGVILLPLSLKEGARLAGQGVFAPIAFAPAGWRGEGATLDEQGRFAPLCAGTYGRWS